MAPPETPDATHAGFAGCNVPGVHLGPAYAWA
jgi:hypothetical protein